MNKYIIELLKLESTVIIPNFGALMKSGKSLIFNSILKYNDGKLENFIAEKENKEVQEVANMVAKHVREIIAEIEKGNEYIINEIGSFYKNENGKFALKTDGEDPIIKSTKTVPVTEIKDPEPKPIKENVIKNLFPEKKVTKHTPETNPVTQKELMDSVYNKEEIKQEEVKPVVIPTKKETPKKEKIVVTEKPKRKKKKGLVWLILKGGYQTNALGVLTTYFCALHKMLDYKPGELPRET